MEELRKNAAVCVSEMIYDGQAEQGVELDHVLPDYYPEIFRILCCRMTPRILSYSLIGDSKLLIDGCVDIRVMYVAENSDDIQCVEQKYTYSKTVDIGRNSFPEKADISIRLTSRADYCNCRAVSGRRIDVRGAVSTRVHITSERAVKLPAIPAGVQVRTEKICCYGNVINATKQFTLREEIETGAAGICSVTRTAVIPEITEVRIIGDKAVVKGRMTVSAAYGICKDGSQGFSDAERMTADIPVSQIIELGDIDDEHTCTVDISVLNCELTCSPDSGIVKCTIMADIMVRCCRTEDISVPVDVFSTEYETEHTMRQLRAMKSCVPVKKQFQLRSSLPADGNKITSVWDCCAEVYNVSCRQTESGELRLTGQIAYQAMCRNAEGVPCCIEKQESFEHIIASDNVNDEAVIDVTAVCIDADHSIKADGALEMTAMIAANICVMNTVNIEAVEKVVIHEDKPRDRNNSYALRIFYADGNEDSWDIAKRYGTPVEAILSENEIEQRDEKLSGMILIPNI